MATRKEQLEVGIIATDKASSIIKGVADAAEKLDGEKAEVELTADDQASSEIDDLLAKISGLTDHDQEVILTAEARKLTSEVEKATKLLADVDGKDFTAVLDAKNQAQEKLNAVKTALDGIDTTTDIVLTADVSTATTELGKVQSAADGIDRKLNGSDQSGSVFANFAGNAAQTLPGVAGAFGPLNMAISQFVEYGSEGNVQLGGLVKSGLAMAVVGATFAALGEGVKLLGAEAKKSEKNVKAISENMDDLNVSASEFLKTIQSNKDMLKITEDITVGWDDYVNVLQEIVHVGDGFQDIDVAQIFDKADISLSRFSRAVTGTMDDVGQMEADLLLAREQGKISQDEYTAALELTDSAVQDVADSEREAAAEAQVFAVDVDTANVSLEGIVDKSAGMAQFGDKWTQLVADVADGKIDFQESADAINEIAAATGKTSDEIEQMAWDTATQAAKDNAAASEEAAQAAQDAADALRDEYIAALEEQNDVLDDSIDKLNEMADAQQSTGDAALDVRDAQRGLNDATENYTKVMEDNKSTANDQADALDDVVRAAARSADAQTDAAAATAKANGRTMTQSQLLDHNNTALLNQANSLEGPMRDAILQYIQDVNGIPNETVANIRAALERGDITEANRLLQDTSRTRTSYVKAEVDEAAKNQTEIQLAHLARDREAIIRSRTVSSGAFAPQRAVAIGTSNARPGVTLVGEQGPELVEFSGGEKVKTAHETAKLLAAAPTGVSNTYIYYPAGYSSRGVTNANRRYARIQGPS